MSGFGLRLSSLVGLVVLSLIALMACEGDRSPVVDESPLRMSMHGGDHQIAPAGTTLPVPLTVLVTDLQGRPVANEAVEWSLDATDGSVEAVTSATEGSGVARASLILPPRAGVHRTTARITAGEQEVVFTSTTLVQNALAIGPAPGETGERADTVLATVAPYRVLATDHIGAPVPGVQITWRAQGAGHPHLSGTEAITDADGIAQVTHRLGWASGEERVFAEVPGLEGSPVDFRATVHPGAPEVLGTAWRIPPSLGTSFSERTYRMAVTDRYLNRVPNVAVDFEVTEGTGTVDPSRSFTGPSLHEHDWASTTHRLGPEEGTETVVATASEIPGSPRMTFSAHVITALSTVAGPGAPAHFVPANLSVPAGRTVGWKWSPDDDPYGYCELFDVGCIDHNVVFDDDPNEPVSSPTQGFGVHFRTFHEPGVYPYRCTIHGSSGIVTVLPPFAP